MNWPGSINGLPYDELPGSPTFSGDRDGPTGRRKFLIPWANITLFLTNFFPAAIPTGKGWVFPVSATFSGRNWLTASHFSVEPFDPDKTSGLDSDGVRTYDYAVVTLDYKVPDYDEERPDPAKDGNQILADQSMAFSAEMLKLGVAGWIWKTQNKDGLYEVIKNEDASVGKMTVQVEHTLNWKYVPLPPFRTIAAYVGCVNSDERLFYASAGTLFFVGAELKRSYNSIGTDQACNVTYKFLQRCIYDQIAFFNTETNKLDWSYGNITWNHQWRNEIGLWDQLVCYAGDRLTVLDPPSFRPVYRSVPFADLFYGDTSDDT